MHWTWLFVATLAPPDLAAHVQQFKYPPLARQARIQGTVRLAKTNGAVTLLSGHPILFPTAFKATESFPPIPGHDTITVTWHFEFTGPMTYYTARPVTIPITNRFERSLRRLLRRKTEKVAYESRCEPPPPPPNAFTITGSHLEIRVFGAMRCWEVNFAKSPSAIASDNPPTNKHPAHSGILEGR